MEGSTSREAGQGLIGCRPAADGSGRHINELRPASGWRPLAPAVEYHFSPSLGLIAGVEFTVAGRNTGRIVSPQVALGVLF